MSATIKSLAITRMDELALPSNVKYGTAIHRRGGVEIIGRTDHMVEAWVGGLDGTVAEGGSQRRRTRFGLKNGKLVWHCTETAKPHPVFCKHCVALALAL